MATFTLRFKTRLVTNPASSIRAVIIAESI
jgi:hypothetical protein